MKDKLTKNTDTRFDRICNKMRKFSVAFLCLAFISFVPLNQKLNTKERVIETQIVALQEEQDDLLLAKNNIVRDRHNKITHIRILKQ
ncbi:MAG: hypothetical protein J1F32_04180 [Erysipelotrichales bacterium]|nr:hypothetical protein [Erysipelotrichales bacterium]